MDWLVWILFFVMIISISGMALGYLEGRRKFHLQMKKEERLLLEAQTKQLEARNRQVELEYKEALLEIERFDRRAGAADGEAATGRASEPGKAPSSS